MHCNRILGDTVESVTDQISVYDLKIISVGGNVVSILAVLRRFTKSNFRCFHNKVFITVCYRDTVTIVSEPFAASFD